MSGDETVFKASDVRLLRERLCWVFKKSPPQIQSLIDQTLKTFAYNIRDYCKCEEKVFIQAEKKYGCLNCGRRHLKLEGDPKLEIVK